MNGHHRFINSIPRVQRAEIFQVVNAGTLHRHFLSLKPHVCNNLTRSERKSLKPNRCIAGKLVSSHYQKPGGPPESKLIPVQQPKSGMQEYDQGLQCNYATDEQPPGENSIVSKIKDTHQNERCCHACRRGSPCAGSFSKEFLDTRHLVMFGHERPHKGAE